MSPRGWGHGQTFAGGMIAGLALSYRPWLIFAAGVAVGVVLMLARRLGLGLVELVRSRRRTSFVHHRHTRSRPTVIEHGEGFPRSRRG